MIRLTSAAIGAVLAVASSAAYAATIDFTASSNTSGVEGGVSWSILASPGDTITFTTSDAPGPIGGLLGANDGVGLNDDEISNGTSGEYITIFFDRAVQLTSFSVLDLFRTSSDDDEPETAYIFAGADPSAPLVSSLEASEIYAPGGFGFSSLPLNVVGDTFTFRAGSGNDGIGTGDFALASIDFSEVVMGVIPLPANILLLGSALAGGAFLGRRKMRKAQQTA